jgi:LAS superfamily LD-carboxypeptidase LdcB
MNAAELTGQARSHIKDIAAPPCHLHGDAVAAFMAMRRAAENDGLDLIAVSSFRDFDRQLLIWNAKWRGERVMNDAHGRPLDARHLADDARVDAILLWSALPGASRHHWGTDVDLIDRRAVPPTYRPELTAAEFGPGGPFAALFEWLEAHAARYGFFRPFRGVRSGVQPEPWHFSFAPVAEGARRALGPAVLKQALEGAALEGKQAVIARLEELHHRFVERIDWP